MINSERFSRRICLVSRDTEKTLDPQTKARFRRAQNFGQVIRLGPQSTWLSGLGVCEMLGVERNHLV